MNFTKRNFNYKDAAPHLANLRRFLSSRAKGFALDDSLCYFETTDREDNLELARLAYIPRAAGFVQLIPQGKGVLVIFSKKESTHRPTLSKDYICLPKLSHLITLSQTDFFILFKILANSRAAGSTADSISLNLSAADVAELPPTLTPFFTALGINYRMNTEYADSKWTEKALLKQVAELYPSRDNQLSAMQFLTAKQNDDLLYFPIETAIELGLEYDQLNDEYCQI